jgi:hypothetical protein
MITSLLLSLLAADPPPMVFTDDRGCYVVPVQATVPAPAPAGGVSGSTQVTFTILPPGGAR